MSSPAPERSGIKQEEAAEQHGGDNAGHKRKREDAEDEGVEGEQKRGRAGSSPAKAAAGGQTGAGDAVAVKREEADEEDEADARPSFGLGLGMGSSSSPSPSAETRNDSLSSPPADSAAGIGAKLLALAGYKGSGGLGRRGTGIQAPIEASTQMATHGLGYSGGVKRQAHSYAAFDVEVEIKPQWLISADDAGRSLPSAREMEGWLGEGPRDTSAISDERYCSPSLQAQLHAAKHAFDDVPSALFRSARERSNPFEKLTGEFFQNRAALKMAEMDAICARIFTSPPVMRAARRRELVYIGDLCAGPGGFSEYVLTVLKWRAVVCGFTLRAGASDFQIAKFNRNAPTHSFHAFYGADGTGDITRSENMRDYRDKVMQITKGKGLHVVMADGGFSVAGRETMQEYLSRQLVLCQCLTALCTLSRGGVFVCKLFDSFLPFTVELLWLLRRCFSHFAIVKPNQSRPANSERYVVCHGLKQQNCDVVQYLFRVNDRINDLKKTYRSQYADRVAGLDFAPDRDDVQRARQRRLMAGLAPEQEARGPGFRSAGFAQDPNADRGDGKDMFGRDVVVKQEGQEEEKQEQTQAAGAVKTEPGNSSGPATAPSGPVELDVLHLVPESVLSADPEFASYMTDRNSRIAARQVLTLHRLKQYVEDPGLPPDDQEAVRRQCLEFWSVTQEPMPPLPDVSTLQSSRLGKQKAQGSNGAGRLSRRSRSRSLSRSRSRSRSRSDSRSPRRRGRSRSRSYSRTPPPRSRSASRSRSRSHSRSRSRSHSRSRSRSMSRTPSPPPSSSRVAARARSPSRSPSPPAPPPFKRGYVHFDPLWQVRHFDPSFPANPRSIFWTSAQTRRMLQYTVAGDMRRVKPLLPLPSERERQSLRLQSMRDPSAPLDARLALVDDLGQHARSWHVLAAPTGGVRHAVWFSLGGMGHIGPDGAPMPWNMQPPMRVPADTLLDCVWADNVLYVLDAYSLPTPPDLHAYRSRALLRERLELVSLFIESCGETRLRAVKPVPLLEWSRSSLAHAHPPDFDLYLLRDGARPPSRNSYVWSAKDDMSLPEVNELIEYVEAKQAPPPARTAQPQTSRR